jgi:hypothetical protein
MMSITPWAIPIAWTEEWVAPTFFGPLLGLLRFTTGGQTGIERFQARY